MEKAKSMSAGLPSSVPDLNSVPDPNPTFKISSSRSSSSLQSQTTPLTFNIVFFAPQDSSFWDSSNRLPPKSLKPPSLVSLCVEVIGKHLEDFIKDLGDIAVNFPPDVKLNLVAIARRRKLLDDRVLMALADSSWEIVDISGSSVSDIGLTRLARTCKFLREVDICRCENITAVGVAEVVEHCPSLETLRFGRVLENLRSQEKHSRGRIGRPLCFRHIFGYMEMTWFKPRDVLKLPSEKFRQAFLERDIRLTAS